MVTKSYIEAAVRSYERLKKDHPTLSSEERQSILLTAAIDLLASNVSTLDSTLDSLRIEQLERA